MQRHAIGWAETRRRMALDLDAYAAWLPGLGPTAPGWRRFAHVLVRTAMFPANLLYRLQAWLYGVPALVLLAIACERLNHALFAVSIGRDARIGGGLHLVHGHVVIDGTTVLGERVSIAPFVTIGLSNATGVPFDAVGPTLGDDVFVGTGAKLLGPIRIGDRARIGANAVVLADVPEGHTAVGVPARVRSGD